MVKSTQKKPTKNKKSWNKAYKNNDLLALSTEPAEDLKKFGKWIERHFPGEMFLEEQFVVDMGCGNGRNIAFVCRQTGMSGIGYDISDEAIKIAQGLSEDLDITYSVRSIAGGFAEIPDESVDLVLDMMSSHVLRNAERAEYISEINRILKPRGWLLFKSFLKDEDLHTKRLLREHPADEENAYIHPVLEHYEYVWSEEKFKETFSQYFKIHKIDRSHKHIVKGKAHKRRTIVGYMEKELE